jgi:hypothetical protein
VALELRTAFNAQKATQKHLGLREMDIGGPASGGYWAVTTEASGTERGACRGRSSVSGDRRLRLSPARDPIPRMRCSGDRVHTAWRAAQALPKAAEVIK